MNEKTIYFTRGIPAVESFNPDQLVECTRSALTRDYKVVMQYGGSRGFVPLRELLASEESVDLNRVILGQGSLQLLDIIARVMTNPGDLVYTENPTYDRTLKLLTRIGNRVTGFTLESDGMNVDEMEIRLKNGDRPVFLYTIPDFQNPSGTALSLEKRKRIAELAHKYKFWIIEDSPYRRLRYRGQDIPSIFSIAPERVLKLSSFSKLICPGLRVGYLVAPEPLNDQIARWAEDTYINSSYLNQAIVYDYCQRGWLDENIQFLKELYKPRLDATLKSLEKHMSRTASWSSPEGGFFVGITLHKEIKTDALLDSASKINLQLTNGSHFFTDGCGQHFVRLPFCGITPEEIEEGVARLAGVVNDL